MWSVGCIHRNRQNSARLTLQQAVDYLHRDVCVCVCGGGGGGVCDGIVTQRGLLGVWGAIITCTGDVGCYNCTGGVGCYNYLHRGVECYNYLHRGVGCYNYLHRGCGVLSLPAQGVWGATITYTGGAGCYNYLHRGCGVL